MNKIESPPEFAMGPRRGQVPQQHVPLAIDLDGTLIKGDLMLEAVILLLSRSLHYILLIPLWLMRGRAEFKTELARRTDIDVSTVLLNGPLIEHLQREKARGRRLFLATGAHERWARSIADGLGLFDGVLATNRLRNLTSHEKLAALREYFGTSSFDYAGNSTSDYPIWLAARQSIVVNAPRRVARWAQRNARVEQIFPRKRAGLGVYLRALRVHQWLKNLLLFLPLVAALRFTDLEMIVQLCIGFASFSLCASSVYVLNDIMDLHDDRRHPRKSLRPFAAGELPIGLGFALIPTLLLAAVALALLLPTPFLAVLGAYYAITLAYTFKLKRIEIIDVLALAMLYTTRVFAGGAAADIQISFWLLVFAVFIFLSLALAKRCAELLVMRERGEASARGRDYQVTDLPLLYTMGTGSGYVAALVLGLYINSPQLNVEYTTPSFLWALVLLVIYWITRVWLQTFRGSMHDDPVVFATRDPASRAVAVIAGVAVCLAI